MIKSFRHKGLAELFAKGRSGLVDARLHWRCVQILDALDVASRPEDMRLPGWRFHALHGEPKRWAVDVNGPWRITFEWDHGTRAALRVDLENYH